MSGSVIGCSKTGIMNEILLGSSAYVVICVGNKINKQI